MSAQQYARGVAALGLAGALLTCAELMLHEPSRAFAGFMGSAIIILVVAHLALPWIVGRALLERRWFKHVVLATSVLYGLSWQRTITTGGALWLRPSFPYIQVACAIFVPAAVAAFVWLCVLRPARTIVAIVVLGSVLVDQRFFRAYEGFHGHLVLANAALLVWWIYPLLVRPALHWMGFALVIAAGVGFALPHRDATVRHVARFSRIPRALAAASPLANLIMTPALDPAWDVDCTTCSRVAPSAKTVTVTARRGHNVLWIVLESTRWDYWADPSTTPEFHRWRRVGSFAKRAATAYPSTILAYDGMFTSLPASVASRWHISRSHRPFDEVRGAFDRLLLTRPNTMYFASQITELFADPGGRVHEHQNTHEATSFLRDGIDRAAGASFFAWAHLYEPHAPYELHAGFDYGTSREERYRSEVAYVDHELGGFMDWFLARPEAKDTLVIVTADHGESLGDASPIESLWGHGYTTRAVEASVPLFIAGPGIPEGRALVDDSLSHLDLLPTVFEFVGAPIPPGELAGRSIYESLREPVSRPVVTERWTTSPSWLPAMTDRTSEPMFALSVDGFCLLVDAALDKIALFDMASDPFEARDIAVTRPEKAAELQAALKTWIQQQRSRLRSD